MGLVDFAKRLSCNCHFRLAKLHLQGVRQTENQLKDESRFADGEEPKAPGQPHEGSDTDSIAEAFGDLLGARCFFDPQETTPDQGESDDVMDEDESDGCKETDVQNKIRSQETTRKQEKMSSHFT